MKNFYASILIILMTSNFTLLAQVGPGGVGSSTNLDVWLDANSLSGTLTDGDPVTTWNDQSGNSNNTSQVVTAAQPVFKTAAIFGNPSIQFDGSNDFLNFNANITTSEITTFSVYLSSKISQGGFLSTQKHNILTQNNRVVAYYFPPNEFYKLPKTNGSYSIFSLQTDGVAAGGALNMINANSTNNFIRNTFSNNTSSFLGKFSSLFFQGQIAEIIIFNELINSAKRRITGNYLAAKYNLIPEVNLFSFGNAHGREVFGIGQEADGSHTIAQGTGIIEISNASSLGNGDYLLIGHDNGGLTTTTSVGNISSTNRFSRTWRADLTGTPGTVDLKFDLAGHNFAAVPSTDYKLLIDNGSGVFDNAGIDRAITGGVYDAINETITFSGVTLNDGEFFTLGDASSTITSIANGNWTSSSTWSCSCVPSSTDDVILSSGFTVSVANSGATANEIIVLNGATLEFTSANPLSINGNFTNEGDVNMSGQGELLFEGTTEQEVINNADDAIYIWDVTVDNSNSARFTNGDFEITNFAKVSAGQFINDGAKITFVSDATNHSQIEPSVANAFSGNFIMKRFFTSRNAGYADITTPTISTTVGDWDQELFMSGVGGDDGNATDGVGGPIQYTVWKYDNSAMNWVAVTDTNTTISAGEPIELFLGDNLTTFSAQTMDNKGTPFTGPRSFNLTPGFNFIGNPYRSFINYTTVTKPVGVNSQFYIFTQDVGAYVLYTGGFIASEQGFWINSTANTTITIQESNKFPLNFNQILRQKRDLRFELAVRNLENGFGNNISLVATDNSADNAAYLKSPEKTAPAITIQADGQELIQQSLSTLESNTTIPVDFYASLDGSYTLSAKDVSEIAGLYNCVVLEDKLENKMIELQENSSYSFNALKGNYERFNLHLLKSSNDCDELLRKRNTSLASTEELQLIQRGNIIELNYQLEEGVQAQLDILSLNGQKAAPSINLSLEGQGTEILMNNENLNGIYLFVLRTNDKVITEKFRLN